MQRKNELLEMASDMGINVFNAKDLSDANKTAIHLLNPDMDKLDETIHKADMHMFPAIVIHSRQTWAWKTSVDEVEVSNDRLLA